MIKISETPDDLYEEAVGAIRKIDSEEYIKTRNKRERAKRIKTILIIFLVIVAFFAVVIVFQKVEREDYRTLLSLAFIIAIGIAVGNYQNSKDKDKKIEQIEGHWKACKSFLDDAREILTKEQNERLFNIYIEREKQKEKEEFYKKYPEILKAHIEYMEKGD